MLLVLISPFGSFKFLPTPTPSILFGKENEKYSFHPLAASSLRNDTGYLPQLVAYLS